MKENMLNSKETADYLGLKEFTLRKWRCLKQGPSYYKIGGKIFYSVNEIESWINKNRVSL